MDQAIADFTRAIDLKPDFVEAYIDRGYAFFKSMNNQRALWDFEEVCRLQPDNPEWHNNRGYLLFQLKAFKKAEDAWQGATALPNAPHFAFAGHAVALWMLKKYERAFTQYRIAIDLDERWRNSVQTFAAEYSWTDMMIRIAQKIMAKDSSR